MGVFNEQLESRIFEVMKTKFYLPIIYLTFCFNVSLVADTLVLLNNSTVSGTIIQTNGDDILLLTDFAAYDFSKANTKEIKIEPAAIVEHLNTDRVPDFKQIILYLSKQLWATNICPIPATVIFKGILRNVPYTSFRCADDYEVNVYGDLEHPAGFEIGVYRKLLADESAKSNCVKFITGLLNQSKDKEIVETLDRNKDLKLRDELTFEITPPTADDSYDGWWISVYSENKLNLARASGPELEEISIAKADVANETNQNVSSWSADKLKLARPSSKQIITYTNKSGSVISDAEVVRVNDGVSLVWKKDGGASMGLVRLEDLPDDLRIRFGYDPAKTAAADELAKQRRAKWQQDVAAQAAQTSQIGLNQNQQYDYGTYSGPSYSGGGRVYVHGYSKRNGTYVNAYTRSSPHRR
jgi:hypothetical protein